MVGWKNKLSRRRFESNWWFQSPILALDKQSCLIAKDSLFVQLNCATSALYLSFRLARIRWWGFSQNCSSSISLCTINGQSLNSFGMKVDLSTEGLAPFFAFCWQSKLLITIRAWVVRRLENTLVADSTAWLMDTFAESRGFTSISTCILLALFLRCLCLCVSCVISPCVCVCLKS